MNDYSKIPAELKVLNQWVCTWDGSKIPMRTFERAGASSTDPSSWGTFEQACAVVEAGYYDQIGFVFADNGIVGIDIDTGFEDGLMTPLCVDIMKACGSYTEKSRSGRGVHIFVKGSLPFEGKNNLQGVEIYRSRRYFICTGRQIVFDSIIENQTGIDYVLGKYFQEPTNLKPEQSKFERKAKYTKIYTPEHKKPKNGRFRLNPVYPEISKGNRHLSMLSFGGSLWQQGYEIKQVYEELCRVNEESCKPPLEVREIQSICNSVAKYQRD